jgi:uncharacterized protein (TIGR00369 family)
MARTMELLQRMMHGEAPQAPIAALLGLSIVAAEPGSVTLAMEAGPQHANPMGTLHGGVLCDLADCAMGMTYATTLADDETFTTLELKINFLKPVWTGRLTAVGRLVKGGATIGLTECDVLDARGRLVARASSTCMTLRGAQAEGRMSVNGHTA